MSEERSEADATAFVASLRESVGIPHAERIARDDVNQPMIRHWCDVMTDHNPIYTDPGFAAGSVHGGIVAPPSMLDTWLMTGLAPRVPQESEAGEAAEAGSVMTRMDAAGFTSVVATNTRHEYDRYLRPGDRLHVRQSLVNVSDEKKTALGVGHFFTTESEFIDQGDESVGRMQFTILKYKPDTGRASAVSDADPDPAPDLRRFPPERPERRESTLRFEDVKVGDGLAPCPVSITPTLIVGGAMASRDFQDVHHDVELAKKRGSPNIFMNIMTSGGLTSRYVGDWAGPEALFRNMKIRLGAPNYPADTMTLHGEVKAAELRDGRGVVEIGVRGSNRLGDHVSGSLELELPRRP